MTGSMCGIILDNGRDCQGTVHPNVPLNLCVTHLQQAFDWYCRTVLAARPATPAEKCPACGELAVTPGAAGKRCRNCYWETADHIPDASQPS